MHKASTTVYLIWVSRSDSGDRVAMHTKPHRMNKLINSKVRNNA